MTILRHFLKGSRKNLLLPAAPLPLNKVRAYTVTERKRAKEKKKKEKQKRKESRGVGFFPGGGGLGVVGGWSRGKE